MWKIWWSDITNWSYTIMKTITTYFKLFIYHLQSHPVVETNRDYINCQLYQGPWSRDHKVGVGAGWIGGEWGSYQDKGHWKRERCTWRHMKKDYGSGLNLYNKILKYHIILSVLFLRESQFSVFLKNVTFIIKHKTWIDSEYYIVQHNIHFCNLDIILLIESWILESENILKKMKRKSNSILIPPILILQANESQSHTAWTKSGGYV